MTIEETILPALDTLQLRGYNKATPFVIKYKNKVLQLLSGKSMWKTAGHAKSAFTNYIEYSFGYSHFKSMNMTPSDVTKYLIEKKYITIEPIK